MDSRNWSRFKPMATTKKKGKEITLLAFFQQYSVVRFMLYLQLQLRSQQPLPWQALLQGRLQPQQPERLF